MLYVGAYLGFLTYDLPCLLQKSQLKSKTLGRTIISLNWLVEGKY